MAAQSEGCWFFRRRAALCRRQPLCSPGPGARVGKVYQGAAAAAAHALHKKAHGGVAKAYRHVHRAAKARWRLASEGIAHVRFVCQQADREEGLELFYGSNSGGGGGGGKGRKARSGRGRVGGGKQEGMISSGACVEGMSINCEIFAPAAPRHNGPLLSSCCAVL